MKVTFFFLAVSAAMVTVVPAAHTNDLQALVKKEVDLILMNDPSLSAAQCAAKCDDLFTMVMDHDETSTDRLCLNTCTHTLHTTHSHSTKVHHTHHHKHTTPSPTLILIPAGAVPVNELP